MSRSGDSYNNSDSDSVEEDEETARRRMADDDRCWDGKWMADGLYGMFIAFVSQDFELSQMEDFLAEQEDDSSLKEVDSFVELAEQTDLDAWRIIFHEVLAPRDLHIASHVFRLCREDTLFPLRLRIQRLGEDAMKELMRQKKSGNNHFAKARYKEAIECYEAAIGMTWNFFIAPKDQMKEIVNCLSNQAECELRLGEYYNAGKVATDALLFDEDHVKSRFRRAKAELAIGTRRCLVQATVDLEEAIRALDEDDQDNSAMRNAVENLQSEVETRLSAEMMAWKEQHPDGDWDFLVRYFRSDCW